MAGRGAATAPLIKQDDVVMTGIEISPHRGAAPAPRPAMQDQHRHTVGIAALFDIDAVAVTHIEDLLIERVDRRIQKLDCALLP